MKEQSHHFSDFHPSISIKRILSCLVLSAFLPILAVAGNGNDSTKTAFVRKYKDRWSVRSIISQQFFNVQFEQSGGNLPRLEYTPNVGPFLGFGLFAFDLGFELSYRLPISDTSASQKGRSKGTDLQARIYSRRFGVDASYQDYTGFYLNNPENFYNDWSPSDAYPQRADMRMYTANFGFFYVFNPRRFSFPAVYTHNEQQIRSAGSPLLTALFNFSGLTGDSGFIPNTDTNTFQTLGNLNNIRFNTFALIPGYAYNLVIKQNLYFSLAVGIGAGFQSRSYVLDQTYSDTKFGVATNWRLGMGYNNKNFFSGIAFFLQQNNSQFDNIRVLNQIGFVRIFFGYRIKEFGVLKRSINEVFPFLESKM